MTKLRASGLLDRGLTLFMSWLGTHFRVWCSQPFGLVYQLLTLHQGDLILPNRMVLKRETIIVPEKLEWMGCFVLIGFFGFFAQVNFPHLY